MKVSLRGGSDQRHEPYEAVTDATGQFKVEDLEPGTYFVQLERSGYTASGKTNRDMTIKVTAGQDTKDLMFHMQVAGVITGKIVDSDGDPVLRKKSARDEFVNKNLRETLDCSH